MGLRVLSPLSALKILPSACRDASKQRNIAEHQGSDLSCRVTGPRAAAVCIIISYLALDVQRLETVSALCHPSLPGNNPHQTLSQCTDATALMASLHPGNGEGESRDQTSLQRMWPSPALLLYLLITIVLQSYFMYLWRQDQPLHFHLTHFHFISAFWFDWISLNALRLAVPAIPFIAPHTGSISTAASLVAPHDCYFPAVMKVVSLPLSATIVYSPQWCVHEKTNRLVLNPFQRALLRRASKSGSSD